MVHVVVIGTGFGGSVMAPAYAENGFEVTVVSPRDRDEVSAAVAAPTDLVSVHSPPSLHAEHVGLAIDHGRNVLCDKPFGLDASQAAAMVERAGSAGVVNLINFEFRHDPARIKIKELLDDGAIGRPLHANWTSFVSHGRRLPHGWLFEKGQGGWIGASGSHLIDALRWWFGEIVDTDGFLRTDVTERADADGTAHASTAEDAFTAHLRMDSGFTAVVDTSFASSVSIPATLTVFGDRGAIQLVGDSEVALLRSRTEPERFSFTTADRNPFASALGAWIGAVRDAVTTGNTTGPTFVDGLRCAEVMDALRSSHAGSSHAGS